MIQSNMLNKYGESSQTHNQWCSSQGNLLPTLRPRVQSVEVTDVKREELTNGLRPLQGKKPQRATNRLWWGKVAKMKRRAWGERKENLFTQHAGWQTLQTRKQILEIWMETRKKETPSAKGQKRWKNRAEPRSSTGRERSEALSKEDSVDSMNGSEQFAQSASQ